MSLQLFRAIFSIEAKKVLSYRVDFWINVIGGLLAGIAIPYFLWSAIFSESNKQSIGGYSFGAMLGYYICATLVSKVVRGNDLPMSIATDIYEGGLNRYLLYPAHYGLFKYAQSLGGMVPAITQLVLFGGAFLWWLGIPADLEINAWSILAAIVSMLISNLLYFLLCSPLQLVSFWADNVWSLLVLLRFVTGLLGGAMLPLSLYPQWAQSIIEWTPFPALFSLPVRTLLGRVELEEWIRLELVAVVWCLVIAGITSWVWHRGKRRYTGVGI